MVNLHPIHPFPARMAPEIALEECASLGANSLVLDPMAGSGTVVKMASMHGHRALGFDLDPLAVLMARAWTTPIDAKELCDSAAQLVAATREAKASDVKLPWIDEDEETRLFIEFWFGEAQRTSLRALSWGLQGKVGAVGDALRVALSRIVITKKRGASLAWDVSHSRPHKMMAESNYQVFDEFTRSVERLAQKLGEQPMPGSAVVRMGDARDLADVETSSVDAVITSPPYLNAIDYMRGHRLSLVWLGYRLGDLRQVRRSSIGAERMLETVTNREVVDGIAEANPDLDRLPQRERGMIDRYVIDLSQMITEVSRVLRSEGRAVFVVGNSCLKGVFVENAAIVDEIARRCGLYLIERRDRDLPPARRYLPPPSKLDGNDLTKRMRSETVLTFVRY